MRPPILRWKVFIALLAVLLIAVTLGSVLGPANQAPMARGTQIYTGWTGYAPLGHTVPIYGPANTPPRMQRRMCANLRAEFPKTSKAVRRALERSMHDICKRR